MTVYEGRLSVKPLKATYQPTSIYVVTATEVITEEGLILTHEQAINSMPWIDENKSIIAAGLDLIPYLTKVLDEWETSGSYFQMMAQPFFRESIRNGKKQRRVTAVKPCYFGFRKTAASKTAYQQIHYLFDPLKFLSDSASAVAGMAEAVRDPYHLMQLVKEYRKICQDLNVPVRVSAASFGAMMLRHPNFFPKPRAKVSRFTNKIAAEAKVGQHEWRPDARALRTIVYALDQRRSHHTCAQEMVFPHGDSLRLQGHYGTLEGKWKDLQELPVSHGLLYADYEVVTQPASGIPTFPELEHKGHFQTWIGTNELTDWINCGAKINHVIAAITSKRIDEGLNRYATYVKSDLEKQRPPYVATFAKMLWFRSYGLLGMRPTRREKYYLHCSSTDPNHECTVREEHLGNDLIVPLHIHADDQEREPGCVNQVWRAMLEREARRRVIMEARRLTLEKGKRIVGIFADSIYVKYPYLIESDETVWKAQRQELSFMDRSIYDHRTGRLIAPGVVGKGREQIICEAMKLPLDV